MSIQLINDEWCIYDKGKGYEMPKGTSPMIIDNHGL